MRRALLAALLLAAGLQLASLTVATSAGAKVEPIELEVEGEGEWQPADDFSIRWNESIPKSEVVSTHWRIYRAGWSGEDHQVPYDPGHIFHIEIPRAPETTYYVAVWFALHGGKGGEAAIPLRFDEGQPAPPRVGAGPAWFGPADAAAVAIEPPAAAPASSLRGYAVSINRGSALPACAGAVTCTVAETDVGPGTRSVPFAGLTEGVYTVELCAVSGAGVRSAPTTTLLQVDASRPEVTLAGAPEGWSPRPVALTAIASDPLSGMTPAGPEGPFTAIAVDGAVPKRAAGATAPTVVSGDGVHSVAYWARDAAGNSGEPGISLAPPARATVRIDGTDPDVSFARGQDPADPELIVATVADSLSGPDPAHGSIAVRPVGSDRAFEPLTTTVAGGRLSARWSSDDYPRGHYEFRATGFDRAGNSSSAVTRADGSAMVLRAPLKAPVALEFGFGARRLVWQRCARHDGSRRCHRQVVESFSRRPATRTLPAGHGFLVGGRLLSAAGAPLRGRAVTIFEAFDNGARPRHHRTVLHSGDDGSFAIRLAAGPSRRIGVTFAGDRLLSRQAGRELRLAVRTGVGLRVSTSRADIGGDPIVFSGRIAHPGAPIPHAGLPVQLEFRLPGRPWEEFRTLQTDAAGSFHYSYSFTDDDSAGVRFLFRARTPPSGGWPFLPGTSRPLPVTGE